MTVENMRAGSRGLRAITLLSVLACGSPTSPTRNHPDPAGSSAPAALSAGTPVAAGPLGASIASFSVGEFQYTAGGTWYYAPQLRIAADSAGAITAVPISA